MSNEINMTKERKEFLYWEMYEYINEYLNSFDDEEGPITPDDCLDAFYCVKDLTGGDFERVMKEIIDMTDEEIACFMEETVCFMNEIDN